MSLIQEWKTLAGLASNQRRLAIKSTLAQGSKFSDRHPDRLHLGGVGQGPFTTAKVTITELGLAVRCTVLVGWDVELKDAIHTKIREFFGWNRGCDRTIWWRWDCDPTSEYQQLDD